MVPRFLTGPSRLPRPHRVRRGAPVAALLAAMAMAAAVVPAPADEPVVAYRVVDAESITDSLTGRRGRADAGRRLYFDRALTGCSGCHGSPGGPGAVPRAGEISAPRLDGLATRMSEGTIRLWIVAPEIVAPGTTMPAFYAVGQRTDPGDPRFGEPLLTASEVEDLVAYLLKAGR